MEQPRAATSAIEIRASSSRCKVTSIKPNWQANLTYNAITSLLLNGSFVRRITDLEKTAKINYLLFSLTVTISADTFLYQVTSGQGRIQVTFLGFRGEIGAIAESNFLCHEFEQFGKQHSRYKVILPSIVLSRLVPSLWLQGGRRVFWGGPKFCKICPIVKTMSKIFFQGAAKICLWGISPSCAPPSYRPGFVTAVLWSVFYLSCSSEPVIKLDCEISLKSPNHNPCVWAHGPICYMTEYTKNRLHTTATHESSHKFHKNSILELFVMHRLEIQTLLYELQR